MPRLSHSAAVLTLVLCAGCGTTHRPGSSRVQNVDVSHEGGAQAEVNIAADPRDPRILIAGSNDDLPAMRAYSSTDGGAHWSSGSLQHPGCGSDPSLAVGPNGREYFSFLELQCSGPPHGHVFVAVRAGARASWSVQRRPVAGGPLEDDRPVIAADVSPRSRYRGRIYVAWTRFGRGLLQSIMLSHTSDEGRTWSPPVRVNDIGEYPLEVSVAVAGNGDVEVAWTEEANGGIMLDHSTDGGAHFGRDVIVGPAHEYGGATCGAFASSIPAQPHRCVPPDPLVTVDRSGGRFDGQVYVTFAGGGLDEAQDVWAAAFDAHLRPLFGSSPARVSPADGPYVSDQFLPTAAVDQQTGRLWVCFYDTRGDRSRRSAAFACSHSDDGARTWSSPERVATARSNETAPAAEGFEYGDYESVAIDADGIVHPAWTDGRRADNTEIYTSAFAGRP